MRLFVGNLPFDVTEQEVREFFASIGPLTFLHLPVDRDTGKPRGFAFVEFADPKQAQEAIEKFNQALFGGRPLSINEARAPGSPPPPRPTSDYRPTPSYRPPRDSGGGGGGWSPPKEEFEPPPGRATSTRRHPGEGVVVKKKKYKGTGEKDPRRSAHTRASRVLDEYDFDEDHDSSNIDDVARKLPDTDKDNA